MRVVGLVLLVAATLTLVRGFGLAGAPWAKKLRLGFPNEKGMKQTAEVGDDGVRRDIELDTAIVGGDIVTDPNKYPWIVSMVTVAGSSRVSVCTGSIVDDRLVFIAAHCVESITSLTLSLFNVCHGLDIDSADCYEIDSLIRHSGFSGTSLTDGNDLAIIRTTNSLLQNGGKILKLSTLPSINQQPTRSVGYGNTNDPNADLTVLRELDTVAVPGRPCNTVNLDPPGPVDYDKFVCGDGDYDNSSGVVCQGDSGSPLLVMGSDVDDSYTMGTLSFNIVNRDTGECLFDYAGAYASVWDEDHLEFIRTAAESLGGTLTEAESSSCDRDAYIQCLQTNDISCVQLDRGDACCETVDAAIDCITPIAENCGNQALIDSIPQTTENLRDVCAADPCFPGSSRVIMENGDEKLMRNLEVGDRVMVKGGSFSDVYAFGHRDGERRQQFVRLECGEHGTLELSGDHYVVSEDRLVLARAVEVGSILELRNGDRVKVTGKSTVMADGVYNPHTLDGTIVVNGVVASTYTKAVHPRVAEILLWIPRALYRLGVKNPLGSLLHGSTPEWIRQWIPKGSSIVQL